VKESRERSFGYVMSRLANADFFRTILNLNIISASSRTESTLRALRRVDGPNSDIALDEILGRAYDADPEVRTEAIRAIGRIASPDTFALLSSVLEEPSGIRCQAALALGKLGDPRALPGLEKGLDSDSVDFQEACAQAIGMIVQRNPGLPQASSRSLSSRLSGGRSDAVSITSADAASKSGDLDAALDIYPLYRSSSDGLVMRRMALALGELLGERGQFYRYVSGERSSRQRHWRNLARKAERSGSMALKAAGSPPESFAELDSAFALLKAKLRDGDFRTALEESLKANSIVLSAVSLPAHPSIVASSGGLDAAIALRRWLIDDFERVSHSARPSTGEILELDLVLSLYALASLVTSP
jgi:HEAT repeat protein